LKRRWCAALLLVSIAGPVAAIDRLAVGVDRIEGSDLAIEGFDSAVALTADGRLEVILRADGVAGAGVNLVQPELRCVDLHVAADRIDCPDARLSFSHAQFAAAQSPARFSYVFAQRRLRVGVDRLDVAGGRAALVFTRTGADWTLAVNATDLDAPALLRIAQSFGVAVPALQPAGHLSGTLRLSGDTRGVRRADWRLSARGLAYSSADGTQAAQDLALDTRGEVSAAGAADWRFKVRVRCAQGQLYADPLYFGFKPAGALSLDATGLYRAARRSVHVDQLVLDHAGVAQAEARFDLQFGDVPKLESLSLDLHEAHLPGFYTTYVQPWVAGTALDQIDSRGTLEAGLDWRDGGLQSVRVDLHDVAFDQHARRFGVEGLTGAMHWGMDERARDSALAWRGAHYYGLTLGAAQVQIETRGQRVRLREPLAVDLLDGKLHVATFELDMTSPENAQWRFDGVLAPVSMEAFSKAVGWPPLAGKLSGVVPDVEYAQHELRVGGTLLVQAFDGDIKVTNLRIEDPAGLTPRLWADVRLDHLDLQTLTRTFSFGRIEGKLQGAVKDLYMEAWQPVAFDARFETPPDDDSPRRISQKAVDSISNLGGAGVSGAVSRSFLRFLDEFPYRRLGIACRLEKGVCHMDGVAPAPAGYYLVQGRFIPPRLDMIGYSHAVDWKTLIDRLLSVTSLPAPSVQ